MLLQKKFSCPDLLESMSDGVAVYEAIDNGQDFLFCEHNPAAEKITGIPREQIIGRRVTEVFPGVEELGLLDVFRRVYRSGKKEQHPNSQYQDGRIILWVENSVFKLPDGKIVAIYRDITREKQTDAALSQANLIINRSPVVAFLWSSEEGWPVQFVSENIVQLSGYSAAEFMGGTISYAGIIHREDFDRVVNEVRSNSEIPKRNSFVHQPYRIITKNGESRWLHDTTHFRRNSDNEITHFEGIVYDISAQQVQQKQINHLSRLRQTGITVHRHLATITDRQELLQAICNVFVNEKGYQSAWIALLDKHQHCYLTANAGLLKDFNLLSKEMKKGKLPACIRRVKTAKESIWQCGQDSLCGDCPLVNGYAESGIMTAPLQHGTEFYGAVGVSLSEVMVKTHEERELFTELAMDISLSLFNRLQEEKREEQGRELATRDQISKIFLTHHNNNLYGKVLDIILAALDSKSGVFGYLDGPDMLICPSMTHEVWDKCQMTDKSISFPRKQWAGIWREALENGTTCYANRSFKVLEGHLPITNSLAAAIVYDERVIGLLQVANKEQGYTEKDKQLLEKLAVTIAPILQPLLEQLEAETKLNEAKKVYEDLYNNAHDMFISVSVNGAILMQCNETLLDTLGYEREEIVGQPVFLLYHPDCLDEVKNDVFPTFCRTGIISNRELQLQRKDGSSLPVILDASAVRDEDNQILYSRSVFHDISERKLLQEQILISEKMTTIAGLAAGVAHEINTPLSGILQSIQLITMGLSPEEEENRTLAAKTGVDLAGLQAYLKAKELDFFLNGIKESANSAAHIVTELLQFSRPRESVYGREDLVSLTARAIALSQADYNLKKKYDILNVEFIQDHSTESLQIRCMAMEIEQVLINLIKNACQAMAETNGPVTPQIILRTRQQDKMAVIEVEDNGPGIDEKIRAKIFDPFFTTKDVGQGTGLGLSVSYSIITDKHGGTIRVESAPGGGARLIIELPVAGIMEKSYEK